MCTSHALAYGVAESMEQSFLVRPEFAAERIHYFVRILTRDLVRQMDSLVAVRVRGKRSGNVFHSNAGVLQRGISANPSGNPCAGYSAANSTSPFVSS